MNAATPVTRESRARLLLVDDEVPLVQALAATLSLEGYASKGCTSGAAALEALRTESFDLMLTDMKMPGMDGIALLRAAKQADPDIAAIVMTGHATIDTAVDAMKAGAYDYIVKPFRLNQILPIVVRALEARRLRRANRELEQGLLERTRELEVANRDLESFAYSVSHDLQAPLRAIYGYCRMFVDDYGAAVPDEGRALLDRILHGATDMSRLIEELLRFARLGREPLNAGPVAMSQLAAGVVDELQRQNAARSVDAEIGEIADCRGDAALLKQVWVNLLSNAFKFTAGRDPAHIKVGSVREDGRIVYFVKDNGVGFAMKDADRLFGVFQRLHARSAFEGTGIGLSVVKRIVERHGGSVWAEGQPAAGATFHFALPSQG